MSDEEFNVWGFIQESMKEIGMRLGGLWEEGTARLWEWKQLVKFIYEINNFLEFLRRKETEAGAEE